MSEGVKGSYDRDRYLRNKVEHNERSKKWARENRARVQELKRLRNPNRERIDRRNAARAAAKAAGERIFHTGEPCPEGHLEGYTVAAGSCYRCSLEKAKAWKAKNRDKCLIHVKRSALKRRLAIKKYQAEWTQRHRERLKVERAEYKKNNHAKILASQKRAYEKKRDYYAQWGAEYRAKNAEAIKARRAQSKAENPEKFRAWDRKKLAKRRGAPGKHTAEDIADIRKMQKGRCAYCRTKLGKFYHVDHITALSRGGSNDRKNLQILCQPCNQAKYALDPIRFAQKRGMLL